MAPPDFDPFNSYNLCVKIRSPDTCQSKRIETSFTYNAPKGSFVDFIAKMIIVQLQRSMLCVQLSYGDNTHTTISRIINEKNIEMNQRHANNVDEPIISTHLTDIKQPFDPVECDSLISESNSLEMQSDEENDFNYFCSTFTMKNICLNPKDSTDSGIYTELDKSVCEQQICFNMPESSDILCVSTHSDDVQSDDDGHFSLDSDNEDWDYTSDTTCDDLSCNPKIPFWQSFFQQAESDDECDGDDFDEDDDEDDDDDISFPPTPTFFNKLFENNKDIETDNTKYIGKANDRWNKIYTDVDKCHTTSKVHFATGEKLETKHFMFAWSYAYQAARKGEWIQIHVDSERFRCRIEGMEQVLTPILDPSHRLKILAGHINT